MRNTIARSLSVSLRVIAPRSEQLPEPEPPTPEFIRAQWHYYDSYPLWRGNPPPYQRPPEFPVPKPLPDEVLGIIDSYPLPHRSAHRQGHDTPIFLATLARVLRAGLPFHVRPYPPYIERTPRIRATHSVGCWCTPPRALPYFRRIAQHYGACGVPVDGAVVFCFPKIQDPRPL